MHTVRLALSLCLTCLICSAAAQAPQLPTPGPKQPSIAAIPVPPPNPASPAQLTPQDVAAFFDGFLPLQLQRDDIAGATISIYRNGQPLLLKGYGYADWKKKTPVDPVATTFRPGSISKLFTYVSMMQLVEQGKLDLDTNIEKYLDFTINPGPSGIGNAPITLRNLATHTGGFEEVLHDFGSDKSGKLPVSIGDFLKRNQPHRFAAPGKVLAYSNYGVTIIGYIVERVSGEPFADYVQHHIFTPLGMTHSTFVQPLPAGMTASLGYQATNKPDTGFEGVTLAPAGGLSSTAADMAIFGQMLLGQGSLNGHTILKPQSVATLFTPQYKPADGSEPWDLGFYDKDRNGLRFIGHGGDLIACHSQFWVEPTHGLAFFISYNSAGASTKAREELFRVFVDRYLPGAPAPHPAYIKLSAKDLAPYTGFYLSSRRADSTKMRPPFAIGPRSVQSTKEGELTISNVTDFRNRPVALHALGNDSFYDEEGQLFVHFERDAQGRITGYVTPGHSDRLSFWMQPLVFNSLLSIACMTLLAIVGAVIYRVWRRIFHRRRAALAPQPGTLWMTPSLQLAAWSFVLLLLYLILVVVHLGEVDNFFAIGHLDPWFAGQNFLTALSMLAMASGIVSGLRMMRRPLRFITRLKFALATFSCAYFLWFYVYFHFIGSAHHY